MGKREEIARQLRLEIESGQLGPGGRIPSEYELAERFGVNKTTANKAVAALVAEGALERGRRGSGTFVRRRNSFRGKIMFIVSIEHPYYARIAHGAQRAALARGYLTTLAAPPPEELNEFVSRLSPAVTQGVLTATYGLLAEPDGVPVIHLDREFPPEARPRFLVNSDGYGGMRLVVEEFLRLGHRELVLLCHNHQSSRELGFVDALARAGVPDAGKRVMRISAGQVASARLLDELFARNPGVTGVATDSDDIAFGLLDAMRRKGLDMPGDISVSGFGNVPPFSQSLELTSVEQHPFDMGVFAANRLLDLIEGTRQDASFCELLPCELVRRHSIIPVAACPG